MPIVTTPDFLFARKQLEDDLEVVRLSTMFSNHYNHLPRHGKEEGHRRDSDGAVVPSPKYGSFLLIFCFILYKRTEKHRRFFRRNVEGYSTSYPVEDFCWGGD
jgi:hypothetical protein